MPKRTYQPKIRRRVRVHGFRARMATADGRAVLKRRRLRGRQKLAAKANQHVKRVRRHGKSYADPLVVLIARRSEASSVHVGVAAGRSVGNAVHRNRAKRLLRAAMRPILPVIAPGWDLMLI